MARYRKDDVGNQTTGFDAARRVVPESLAAETGAPSLFRRRKTDYDAKLAESNDRAVRASADLDNYRKRFDRELTRLRSIDREEVLLALLGVVDNMERALESGGGEDNVWAEGMTAIHQQMISVLRQFGAETFRATGQIFNPQLHEAISTVDLPQEPEGKIVEVVQTGYTLGGKVLRPARVIAVKRSDFKPGLG